MRTRLYGRVSGALADAGTASARRRRGLEISLADSSTPRAPSASSGGRSFLGYRLSAKGLSVDPRKMQSIVEWATPTSWYEVRRFTGLANYYRHFVEGCAEVAAPLARQPDSAIHVDGRDARALPHWHAAALKMALSSAPVLRTFEPPSCRPDDGHE